MTRISTHGTSQLYLSYITKLQVDSAKNQVQVATGMKSPNYSGIARDTNLLLNYENEAAIADQYVTNCTNANTRLEVAATTLDAVNNTMRDFRDRLQAFRTAITTDQNQIEELQKWAFTSMKDMQAYMLTDVNGQYIFGGSRTDTEPVHFDFDSLDEFQATYDGADYSYPTTRNAHLYEIDANASECGSVTFDSTAGTMKSDKAIFDNMPVGAHITLTGTNAGTYTISGNDGASPATITLSPAPATTVASATNVTAKSQGYYYGDTTPMNIQVDNGRTIQTGLFGNDPAFEKAFRAMGIIAQGRYGTTGGLDNPDNKQRIADALYLIRDAIDSPAGDTPPYGEEEPSDMKSVSASIGFAQNLLSKKIDMHKEYIGFLTTRTANIQNVDKTEAIVQLQDNQIALQASYKTLAEVRSMSLLDYVK